MPGEMADDGSSRSFVGLVVSEQFNEEEEEASLLDIISGAEFPNSTEQLLFDIEGDDLGQKHSQDDHQMNADTEIGTYENDGTIEEQNQGTVPLSTGPKKKKIKNRHIKAAIMIAIIWTIMVAFLIVALSVDWWYKGSIYLPDLCTLCHNNSYEIEDMWELTEWPTRKPSSSTGSSLFTIIEKEKTLRPPPENIAEVCSPSIYLDYGVEYMGPSVNDLLAICANACFPGKNHVVIIGAKSSCSTEFSSALAMCCVINDENAMVGLINLLQSQGLGSQAAIFLSTIQNCYVGDNIETCDEYGQWCQILYTLDVALEDTISKEMEASCALKLSNSTSSPRVVLSNEMSEDCSILCNKVSCCYGNVESSTTSVAIQRKKKRHHFPFDVYRKHDGISRSIFSNRACDLFNSEDGSLNAAICDAYRPYCNPLYSAYNPIYIPSLVQPTMVASNSTFTSNYNASNTSYFPTMSLSSHYPTISMEPSLLPNVTESNSAQSTASPNIQLENESLAISANSSEVSLINQTLNVTISDVSGQNSMSSSPSPSVSTQGRPTIDTGNESLAPAFASTLIPTISTRLNATLIGPSLVIGNDSLAPSLSVSPISSETPATGFKLKTIAPSVLLAKNESISPSINITAPED